MDSYIIRRPYSSYGSLVTCPIAQLPSIVQPGSIIAIELSCVTQTEDLRTFIEMVRQHLPWVVLMARVRGKLDAEMLHVVTQCGRHGVSAVVHDAEALATSLRRQLTSEWQMPAIPNWLESVIDATSPQISAKPAARAELVQFARVLFCSRSSVRDVTDAAELLGRSLRSTRRLLHNLSCPPPASWVTLAARLLPGALKLQSGRYLSLAALAAESGWADQSSFTHAYVNAFGWTPAQIARRLGWEWLVYAWLKRNARCN
jgi:AraC-like DNA-binding protein